MSDEAVFFPPYDATTLAAVLEPRLARAFRDGALPDAVREYGIREAARRWGDARKALTLFRQAGETATERGLEEVTEACLVDNLDDTDREATVAKLQQLPVRHLAVLAACVGTLDATGTIAQPVRTSHIHERLHRPGTADRFQFSKRTIRTLVTDLETMGLVDTWVESQGRDGRARYVETTFEPAWVDEAQAAVAGKLASRTD